MKKSALFVIIPFLLMFVVMTSTSQIVSAQEYVVPGWIKSVAGLWSDEQISDKEFGQILTFLISNNIIQESNPTSTDELSDLEKRIKILEIKNTRLENRLSQDSKPSLDDGNIDSLGDDPDKLRSTITSLEYENKKLEIKINSLESNILDLQSKIKVLESKGIGLPKPQPANNNQTERPIKSDKIDIAIFTDRPKYSQGDIILLSGKVSDRIPDEQVTIIVSTPNGDRVYFGSTRVDSDKTFSTKITTDDLMQDAETYTVKVYYGYAIEIASFYFDGHSNPQPPIYDPPKSDKIDISVTTDRSKYSQGDIILLSGKVSKILDEFVTIIVNSPDGDKVLYDHIALNHDKSFNEKIQSGNLVKNDVGTYTITVYYGSDFADTQIVIVQDTTLTKTVPPERPSSVTITAPSQITVDATGILTYVDLDKIASASGSLPITITNNATSSYLPIGDTVISYTATDKAQNSATTNAMITITADNLDSNWYYKLIEISRNYLPYSAVIASKHTTDPSLIALSSSDVNEGILHLFKSFPKSQIQYHDMTLDVILHSRPALNVYLLDGSYSITEATDFVSTQPIRKGGGVLYSYTHSYTQDSPDTTSDLTIRITPNWSLSELDTVTLFIDASRPPHGQKTFVGPLQIDDHSRWVFDDYKVQQGPGTGTFVLVPPTDEALVRHQIPIHDTFDDTFDGWTYWGSDDSYTLGLSMTSEKSSVHMGVDGVYVTSGIAKIVDISALQESQRLLLSTDFRATSTYSHITTTNAQLIVYDADSGDQLYRDTLVAGDTIDTGWQIYTADLTDHVSDSDAIKVVFYTVDSWSATYPQDNWYDNIRIYATDSG